MTRRFRARLLTTAVLTLVLAAGFSLGLAVDRPSAAVADEARTESQGTSEKESRSPSGSDRIIKRLDLDGEQRHRVDSLLRLYHEEMTALQKEYVPRYWEVVDSSRSRIKEVLTEDQAALYDSLLMANDRRRGRSGARDGKR